MGSNMIGECTFSSRRRKQFSRLVQHVQSNECACVLTYDPIIWDLQHAYEKNIGSQKEVYKKQLAIYEQITILLVKKKHMKPWTNALAYNNDFLP